jgi:small subunit ribosomal protein S4e
MHLKRYSMPGFWPLSTKAESYVTTPMPGPHGKYASIPLKVVLRDVLKLAQTSKEAVSILNSGKVMVDKKVRKETRFPIGLMDVFEIPELHARYRVGINKAGLGLEKIGEDETGFKLCKIVGKTTMKGGRNQISLHDGRNMLTKEPYSIGDSIMIELPGQKVLRHFGLRKGEPAFIIAGRNTGVKGKIKDIKERKSMLEKSTITIETSDGKDIQTLKDYVMVGSLHEDSEHKEETKEAKKPAIHKSKEKA